MAHPPEHLVFDIGGTQLRAALWQDDAPEASSHGESARRPGVGHLSEVRAVGAPSFVQRPASSWNELRANLVDAMSSLRNALDPDRRVTSVAVSFPGPIDGERGVLAAPTLWGTTGSYPHAFATELERAWPETRVRLLNDVTAAGYRYLRGEDETFCVVTVSTGIGNKVFVGGRPEVGRAGHGGEIGHLRVDSSEGAPACDCGGRGHLGAIASGRGAERVARSEAARSAAAYRSSWLARSQGIAATQIDAAALARAYQAGDPWGSEIVERGARALGGTFASLHLAMGVERFVLIGGYATGLGQRYADAVCAFAREDCWTGQSPIQVDLGKRDGRCALLGAGRAASLAS